LVGPLESARWNEVGRRHSRSVLAELAADLGDQQLGRQLELPLKV
jgi:hypothetical protein